MSQSELAIVKSDNGLSADIRAMIAQTRAAVATAVNSGITLLYWRIGKRIQTEVLENQRAAYGKEILQTLSAKLTDEFGSGFSQRNLRYMVTFAEVFPDGQIVATLSQQLGWSHFKAIIPPEGELDQSGIHVVGSPTWMWKRPPNRRFARRASSRRTRQYFTALPPQELLRQKLHAAIETARARFES